jgi:hypothetical protein
VVGDEFPHDGAGTILNFGEGVFVVEQGEAELGFGIIGSAEEGPAEGVLRL